MRLFDLVISDPPRANEDEDHIFRDEYGRPIDPERLAEKFRHHLKPASVERRQLYETTANRRQIRAHDLRATFITIALATPAPRHG